MTRQVAVPVSRVRRAGLQRAVTAVTSVVRPMAALASQQPDRPRRLHLSITTPAAGSARRRGRDRTADAFVRRGQGGVIVSLSLPTGGRRSEIRSDPRSGSVRDPERLLPIRTDSVRTLRAVGAGTRCACARRAPCTASASPSSPWGRSRPPLIGDAPGESL